MDSSCSKDSAMSKKRYRPSGSLDTLCAKVSDDASNAVLYHRCQGPTSAQKNNGKGDGCFHSDALVQKRISLYNLDISGKNCSQAPLPFESVAVPISSIRVGDFIQVPSSSHLCQNCIEFSEVVFIPHDTSSWAGAQLVTHHDSIPWIAFVEVITASGLTSLRLTPDHLLPVASKCACKTLMEMKNVSVGMWTKGVRLKYARNLSPGSCVITSSQELDIVVSSKIIWEQSTVHTVVTKQSSGLIIVDGIVASSFSVNHFVVNTWYNSVRWAYKYSLLRSALESSFVVNLNEMLGDVLATILHAVLLPK